MSRKFITSTVILLILVMAIFLFWKDPILLSAIILITAYPKYRLYPIKLELLWFTLICIGGAIVEILLDNIGEAWNYASAQLFNIPIWMPLFWGAVGTTIIVIYEGITDNRN